MLSVVVSANLVAPTGGPEGVASRTCVRVQGVPVPEGHVEGWVEFVGRVLEGPPVRSVEEVYRAR